MHTYPFKAGVIIGRFQMIHHGHVHMIRTALNSCEQVLLFIGSSQEEKTAKNPLSYLRRVYLLKRILNDEVESKHLRIEALPDIGVGNNAKWGEYVLKEAREIYNFNPDVMISGMEGRRTEWFDDSLSEILIAKNELSATLVREAMIRDDRAFWQQCTPQELWDEYDDLRSILLRSQPNTCTSSL